MASAILTTGPSTRADGARRALDTKTVAAAVLGNAFEFYDFTVYAAFAAIIGRAFFPTNDPSTSLLLSVATFGVGFIARPLGGIVIGAYADRFGRRPAMTLTIWLMALGSGMIGVIPSYATIGVLAPVLLVVARLVQGFSAGGEMGPATTFLVEAAPAHRKSFYGSWQLSSQNIGVILSGLLGVVLAQVLPPAAVDSWGWRIPFLIGILIAPIGIYIRRQLEETLNAEEAHGSMGAVLSDLAGRHWRPVVLCVLVVSGGTVAQYFFGYATTYAITTLGLSTTAGFAASLVVGVSGAIFALAGGVLADRYGLRAVCIIPRIVVTLLFYPAMLLVVEHLSPALFIAVMALLAAPHAMSGAAGIVLIPRCFPAPIRTAGLSIAYAIGVTVFGGSAQLIFTWLIEATGSKLAPLWYVTAMSVVSILATVALARSAERSGRIEGARHAER